MKPQNALEKLSHWIPKEYRTELKIVETALLEHSTMPNLFRDLNEVKDELNKYKKTFGHIKRHYKSKRKMKNDTD